MRYGLAAMLCATALQTPAALAQSEVAAKFGMQETVADISLSPDGKRVAFVSPAPRGPGTTLNVADVEGGVAKIVLAANGKPERIRSCDWSSARRIVCQIYMLINDTGPPVAYTRAVTLDPDSKDVKILTARQSDNAHRVTQFGGTIIDWLPDENSGAVLMTRDFVPDTKTGTRMGSNTEGLGVERVDTATLKRTVAELPRANVAEFITDGHGQIRVLGFNEKAATEYQTDTVTYRYRPQGSNDLKPLSVVQGRAGFNPFAVDKALNAVYGFEPRDGRLALYRIALDGSMKKELMFDRPDVDIDGVIRIGRQKRVVGVSFASEKREAFFFDPALKALAGSLSKALPKLPLVTFIDASADETKLLFWAGSDEDPGRYYLFDRTAKKVSEILLSRPALENAPLAKMQAIRFTAADGTSIPAYLTLPPGSNGKGLPAIVMPHGGPSARDEWGFDWMVQYFATRGFAVLQPNYRGSAGYGDGWFQKNGFRSWKTAIGDVNDGGRWLLAQGIAAPGKLAIFGWSYGGYAALQSPALDPDLFKAIVAVAPVTDLEMVRDEARNFVNFNLVSEFIGTGPHVRDGSPARNVDRIKAPVLLFHGDTDANVGVAQSRTIASRLRDAGKKVEYVEFAGLDHQLGDNVARTTVLDKSDTFLRAVLDIK